MFVAVLCGDGGRGRNAFINRRYYRSGDQWEGARFCGPNTKPTCRESALRAKLRARHHNCVSPGFTVCWEFKENMCFGGNLGYAANTASIHMAGHRGSPDRVWTNALGMRNSHQSELPQHPLQDISSILRARATSRKESKRWTAFSVIWPKYHRK